MSSRDQIYQARRKATLNRIIQERRISAERAESVVAAWEAEAERRDLARDSTDFWSDGQPWIEAQLEAR